MIDHSSHTAVDDSGIGSERLANLLFWFVTRYNDMEPNPCPEPNTSEEELARELIDAKMLEAGAFEGELIPTPEGWVILGPFFDRLRRIGR